MPNTSPLTLNDGTAEVVFSPESVTATHVLYQDLSAATLEERSLLHFDRPSGRKKNERRIMRINRSTTHTQADGTSVIETGTVRVEIIPNPSATATDRAALRALGASILNNTEIGKVVDNPEWFW